LVMASASVFEFGMMEYTVDMQLHAENRAKLLARLADLGPAQVPAQSAVILEGGHQLNQYDTDGEPLFRQESFFQYLFGIREPECYGALDLATGESLVFVPRLGSDYEIWCGKVQPLSWWKARYQVEHVFYADEVAATLRARGVATLIRLHGHNTDSGLDSVLTARFEGVDSFVLNDTLLHHELSECRVIKTAAEIELLRHVNNISSHAHMEVMRRARPGMKEFQLESLFQHECYFRGGSRRVSYTCICGSGPNGATLHYGHAGAPNDRVVGAGDMLLLDMGAEYHF
jgi:Xaa-Pro dipeptidase